MQEHRIKRIFGIIGRLSPYSQVTVADLCSEYGVSAKSIERDIDVLRNAKLGVYKDEDDTIKIHRHGYGKIRAWMSGG